MKKEKNSSTLFYGSVILFLVAVILFFISVLPQNQSFSQTAVTVNDEVITLDQVRLAYITYPQIAPQELLLDIVLDDLIAFELLVQHAASEGYTPSSEEVQNFFQDFLQEQQISQEQFEQLLVESDLTLEEYLLQIERDLSVQRLFESMDIQISEEQARTFYQSNLPSFLVPGKVFTQQLTLPLDIPEEELLPLIEEIFQELQEQEFCDVVAEYSTNPECQTFEITEETAFEEYREVAFAQEEGQITLIQGPDGFYFIRTIAKQDFNPVPFSDISESITELLEQQQFEEDLSLFISSLREEARIVEYLR